MCPAAHARACLCDGRVPHALGAVLLQQAPRDLVSALVLRHLLPHDEHALITSHLLVHGCRGGRVPRRGEGAAGGRVKGCVDCWA